MFRLFLDIFFVKYSLSEGGFHYMEHIKMAGTKAEKEARFNYTIQPFAREFFDVQLLAAKDQHVFFSV
jgi:hypothetical protein